MNKIKIALLGLGVVGTGVIKVLEKNKYHIQNQIDTEIEIAQIFVKNLNKQRAPELDSYRHLLTDKFEDILNSGADIIVEVMGGIHPTKEYLIQAIGCHMHIVSANKDLFAEAGPELKLMAYEEDVMLLYEAAVAAGIPIVKAVDESFSGNEINEVMGIINGTTNYILTHMTDDGVDFEPCLKEAQDLGFAELNPDSDILGLDSARKVAILASHAFHTDIYLKDVYVEGITTITKQDIEYAKQLDYCIKLLGIAKKHTKGIELRVHPTMIPKDHPLASIKNEFNAIFVNGDAVGEAMFVGKGAGELPTASAVVGDVMDLIKKTHQKRRVKPIQSELPLLPFSQTETKYYLRIHVSDNRGSLAMVTKIFNDHEISVAVILQKRTPKDYQELVIVTHVCQESHIKQAIKDLEMIPGAVKIANLIRVEDPS